MGVQSAPPIPHAQSKAACRISWLAHGLAMHQNLSVAFTTIGEDKADGNVDDEDDGNVDDEDGSDDEEDGTDNEVDIMLVG